MPTFLRLPQLIFFGDSLTQFGWSYDGGWLTILADAFVRRIDIINRGYSGYNTRMCRHILPDLYPDRASLSLCRMFVIFLGTNDASKEVQHVPVDEYKDNLKAMVTYLNDLGIQKNQVMMISPPPLDEAKWGSCRIAEGKPVILELKNCPIYAEACGEVATSLGVTFINLYEAMFAQNNWTRFFNDGLHFSRQGSEFLAQILTSVLQDKLSDCPVCLPDWKMVNKMNPAVSFQQYKNRHVGLLATTMEELTGNMTVAHSQLVESKAKLDQTDISPCNVNGMDDSRLSPLQKQILALVRGFVGEKGMPVSFLCEKICDIPEHQLREELDILNKEGYVYPTSDPHHFRATCS